MTIQIQDNFELPETAKTPSRMKYPFAALQVGQGFTVEGDENLLRSAASALSRFKSTQTIVVLKHAREPGKLHVHRVQ